MAMNITVWLTGFAAAAALLLRRLKRRTDNKGERIAGSILIGIFSWAAVAIILMELAIEKLTRK